MPHNMPHKMIVQHAHSSLDVQKCFQQAFDRTSKHRKTMFRAISHILALAKERGFLKIEKMRMDFQHPESHKPQQDQWLTELFEFVSPDECLQLIQGFQSFAL